jgi:chemotaxis protein methyltransferase CheR
MTPAQYKRVAGLVYQRSGIHLGDLKTELLRARMNKRLRALNITSVKDYILRLGRDEEEAEKLVDVVTTNKTEFFRESGHFHHLAQVVVPAFLQSEKGRRGEPMRVWSAACSSGEEAYSLAMVLEEAMAGAGSYKILATDISSRMIRKAVDGIYSEARLAGMPHERKAAYFERTGLPGEYGWSVRNPLRQRVHFFRFNLTDSSQYVFRNRFDAVFCRNVMIYFDRPTQETVVSLISGTLARGGFLYTGYSESLVAVRHTLKPAGASVYLNPSPALSWRT